MLARRKGRAKDVLFAGSPRGALLGGAWSGVDVRANLIDICAALHAGRTDCDTAAGRMGGATRLFCERVERAGTDSR